MTLEKDGVVLLCFASTYGFRNIQNLVQRFKRGKCPYHFVEVMACPSGKVKAVQCPPLKWCWPSTAWFFTSLFSGCLNGGGQLKALPGQNPKELLQKVEEIYRAERPMLPEDNTHVAELYHSWLRSIGEEKAKELLHTQYHTVEKMKNGLTMKWWPIPVAMGDQQTGYWSIFFALTIEPSE